MKWDFIQETKDSLANKRKAISILDEDATPHIDEGLTVNDYKETTFSLEKFQKKNISILK